MEIPSLSILVPTYNRANLLRQTLDSIAEQTFRPANLEVIVSNDGSTDETATLLDEFQARLPELKVFHQTRNLGLAGNWAFLLTQARGDLVFLLCHDDAIPPDFLESCLGLFRDDPTLDLLCGDIELRGPGFERLTSLPLATPEGARDGLTRCREQLFSHHMVMSTIYRKATLLAAGGWDGQVGSHLDCTAFCRTALRARRTVRLARPMLYFRILPGSCSHQLSTQNQPQLARWYRRKLDLLTEDARTLTPQLLPFLADMYVWHAKTVMAYLEIELANHRLSGSQVRSAVRALLEVFPEARRNRMSRKLWLASVFGIGWLKVLRRLTGRPDPYRSSLALFNSFPTPKEQGSVCDRHQRRGRTA